MALIDSLLPAFRDVASALAGSEFADDALTDVKSVESIAAKHAAALESELVEWLTSRLHPAPVQPAV